MRKKIIYISGTRADYGLMRTVLQQINQCPEFDLEIIATGMHLMPEFGESIGELRSDGFRNVRLIPILHDDDTRASMSMFVGNLVVSLSEAVRENRPDIILLLGDRAEMLAGAIVGTYMAVPVIHIHGGEITSTVDEPVRHAISKLANIHLAATSGSARRLIRMGEDPRSVHVVGAPGLDAILQGTFTSPPELYMKYRITPGAPLLLVIQHPVSAEIHQAGFQIRETLEAVAELGHQTIVLYPNADAGGRQIISQIQKYRNCKNIQTFKNLPHDDYLGLLRIASVLIGNSSSGIIEAPSFHLPVVNIGSRQEGRERSQNVIDTGHDKEEIKAAITTALNDRSFQKKVLRCRNPYGDGNSGERIVRILRSFDPSAFRIQKRNRY